MTKKARIQKNKRIAIKMTNIISDFMTTLIRAADELNEDREDFVYFAIDTINKYRPAPELLENWDNEENTADRESLKAKAKNPEEKTEEYGEGNSYINLSVKKEKDNANVRIDAKGNVCDQLQLIATFLKDTAENIDVPKEKLLLMVADVLFGDIDEGENE